VTAPPTIPEVDAVALDAEDTDRDVVRPREQTGPVPRMALGSDDFPATETEAWQWSRRLVDRIRGLELHAADSARKWKQVRAVLTGVAGVAVTALVAAFKLAYSSGASSGVASERDRQSREVEAIVHQLRVDVARLTGELRSLSRNRSQEPDR
jgi:hypothetical protein